MNVLLVALAFCSCCHHWSAAANAIICEAVGRESSAEPSCQPVEDSGAPTPSLSAVLSGAGPKSESCAAASTQSDGAKVMYSNGTYSISGLQNFSVNGSYVGYCPSDPTSGSQGGCVEPKSIPTYYVENLRINYSPVGKKLYKATLTWNYYKNDPTPRRVNGEDAGIKAYRLWVQAPGIKHPGYCVCINSTINLTDYSLILEYSTTQTFSASIYTFPYYDLPPNVLFPPEATGEWVTPDNCADYDSGVPYNSSTCNVPYYGKPRNVKVDRNTTHTTLSWDKPCYQDADACHLLAIDNSSSPRPGPDTYYLTATVNGLSSYFAIYDTTEVTLTTPGPVDFKLYTHTPCSGACDEPTFKDCSQPAVSVGEPDDGTCCTTVSPTTATSSNTMENESSDSRIYLPVGVVMVLAAVVVLVL